MGWVPWFAEGLCQHGIWGAARAGLEGFVSENTKVIPAKEKCGRSQRGWKQRQPARASLDIVCLTREAHDVCAFQSAKRDGQEVVSSEAIVFVSMEPCCLGRGLDDETYQSECAPRAVPIIRLADNERHELG